MKNETNEKKVYKENEQATDEKMGIVVNGVAVSVDEYLRMLEEESKKRKQRKKNKIPTTSLKVGKNLRKITVTVDHSIPTFDWLHYAVGDFLDVLMDNCPNAYFVEVEIGCKNPEKTVLPKRTLFFGMKD